MGDYLVRKQYDNRCDYMVPIIISNSLKTDYTLKWMTCESADRRSDNVGACDEMNHESLEHKVTFVDLFSWVIVESRINGTSSFYILT